MMFLNNLETEALQHYNNVKSRVLFIYGKSQEAVDCNKRLLFLYKQLFGELDLCEESITRAGRYWRNPLREKEDKRFFKRSEDLMARDTQLEGLNQWIWSDDG